MMSKKIVKLSNGVEMPILGFGTYQIDPTDTANAVREALVAGYRHIDTAQAYGNEKEVGEGIRKSGIAREEIFVTTKVWLENVSYEGVLTSFERSLRRLDLDYLDLLLIHQPYSDIFGAWRAMEELYEQGRIKAIGVSNFNLDRVVDLAAFRKISPMVNQVEINPFMQRVEAIDDFKKENVAVEAWAPFAEGKNNIFHNETLQKIGDKYSKSIAQVILRWLVQKEIVVLAKSTKPERMKENLDIFDFELSTDDLAAISKLDTGDSQFFSHQDTQRIKAQAKRHLDV